MKTTITIPLENLSRPSVTVPCRLVNHFGVTVAIHRPINFQTGEPYGTGWVATDPFSGATYGQLCRTKREVLNSVLSRLRHYALSTKFNGTLYEFLAHTRQSFMDQFKRHTPANNVAHDQPTGPWLETLVAPAREPVPVAAMGSADDLPW